MTDTPDQPAGEIVLYETADGRTRVECRFEHETLWLTQALMAELFQTTPQNITLHMKALYEEGEIEETATCKEYLQVRREGTRDVQRSVKHYSLDAICENPCASVEKTPFLQFRIHGQFIVIHSKLNLFN